MKTLKFKGFKAERILEGTKTSTLRLFDDKGLVVGDELELINSETGEVFARAIITEIIEKKLGEITEADLEGHEKWADKEDMMQSLRKYYTNIDGDTVGKIVRFKLL